MTRRLHLEVVDEYRWLEDEGSEATTKWTAAQDAPTRAHRASPDGSRVAISLSEYRTEDGTV